MGRPIHFFQTVHALFQHPMYISSKFKKKWDRKCAKSHRYLDWRRQSPAGWCTLQSARGRWKSSSRRLPCSSSRSSPRKVCALQWWKGGFSLGRIGDKRVEKKMKDARHWLSGGPPVRFSVSAGFIWIGLCICNTKKNDCGTQGRKTMYWEQTKPIHAPILYGHNNKGASSQSNNQSINQWMTNRSINQSMTNQSINQSIDRTVNQQMISPSIEQSTKPSINCMLFEASFSTSVVISKKKEAIFHSMEEISYPGHRADIVKRVLRVQRRFPRVIRHEAAPWKARSTKNAVKSTSLHAALKRITGYGECIQKEEGENHF